MRQEFVGNLKIVYKNLCPNCGSDISSDRLFKGLACESCQPNEKEKPKYGPLLQIEERNRRVEEIEKIFETLINAKMWALQRFWVRRFLENESFALIAPTGSGKTTIQIILSLYAAKFLKKRCLIILPTSLLVKEVSEKTKKFAEKLRMEITIASYHSMLSTKEKKEELEKMGSAEIIITTHLSIIKREEINKQNVDVVFVDDVDSFLRKSKSVRFVLKMVRLPQSIKNVIDGVFEKSIDLKKAVLEISKLKEKESIESQLIVSGATHKARRTKSIIILNSVFGFSTGLKPEFGRNIVDCFVETKNLKEEVLHLIRFFGNGGLIFVPMDKGSEFAEELERFLWENGIKVKAFLKPNKKTFEEFKNGELDALIGMVTTRSPLVRGIDLPERIRYAIFVGVPKFVIKIKIEEFSPTKWLLLLNNIQQAIKEEYKSEYERLVANLIKIRLIGIEKIKEVRNVLAENKKLEGSLGMIQKIALEGVEFFTKILKDEEVLKAIKESPTISFSDKESEYTFLIPDSVAYIQASGRTSRLYVGGTTKGLSVVIIDEEKAFNSLKKELSYFEEIEWKNLNEVNIRKIIKDIDADRKKVKLAIDGKLKPTETKMALTTRLFIVESPTKVKTIARFFGKPSKKKYLNLEVNEVFGANSLLIIAASKGHVTDLSLKEGLFGVDIKDNNFIPYFKPIKRCVVCGREIEEEEESCVCGSTRFIDAKPRIEALRKVASLVDEVIIATDPDSEGEKIAYDLYLLLKPLNKNIKRARFHEVTKKEILRVLENLETFDLNLVKAQIVRRIEDRWIGFGISPVLWKVFNNNKLSAGRVQTPVLGWIVERTKKLNEKEELITLQLENGLEISFRAKKGSYWKIVKNGFVEIKEVKIYEEEINPYPPFTTDTLISALTSFLKINANEAMQIAQKLFENGLITYHRTSSTTVSSAGINLAKEYISSTFGESFFKARKWEMEGAHECIRPTKAIDSQKLRNLIGLKLLRFSSPLTEKEIRAYDIIFKRFIASQMKASKVEKIKFKILFGEEREFEFINRIIDEGFSKIFRLQEKRISELKEGKVKILKANRKIVPAFYPFTYSEIVSLMKERRIGRPSTYAKILEVLKKRKYVEEIKKSLLISTKLGAKVFWFSQMNFAKYLNEETTRKLEEEMDSIESGKKDFEEVLNEIYSEVKEVIKRNMEKGVRYPSFEISLIK
jgi:reverse gyrase